MTEQYLILHKVRGEPSFDCATKLQIGDEEGWITNSGHRAYPYEIWGPMPECFNIAPPELYAKQSNWADWPDHYQVKAEPKIELNIGQLLSGLVKFKRRF